MRGLFPCILALLFIGSQIAVGQDRQALEDELDIFAAAHLDKVQVKSIADNVEYCGLFGWDATGRLAATAAKRGLRDSCEPEEEPADFEVLASYHTHAAYSLDADSEVPSLDDLEADIDEEIDGYIATPGGRLWLNLAEEEISVLLCGPGCVTADPAYRPCKAYPAGDEYTLAGLRQRADEDSGVC